MNETFPHYHEDGYYMTGPCGWKQISYWGIYRNTFGMPYQWNNISKRKKPVSEFITSQRRGKRVGEKKCWYGCDCRYQFSEN